MRPIDAGIFGKALSEWCSREFEYYKATYGATPKVVSDTLRKVINMLADQPALDYAPVVHGSWVEYDEGNPLPLDCRYRCALCGCQQDYAHNFCPNCGARMDGEK